MDTVRRISDAVSSGPQPAENDMPKLAREGFLSVLNVRPPFEPGTDAREFWWAVEAGLRYEHVPLDFSASALGDLDKALRTLDELPPPVFVHSGHGERAAILALLHLAQKEGLGFSEMMERAQSLRVPVDDGRKPVLKEWLESRPPRIDSERHVVPRLPAAPSEAVDDF